MHHVVRPNKRSVASLNRRINGSAPVLVLFHADWCPHCIAMKPEWEQLVSRLSGTNARVFEIEHTVVEYIRRNDLASYANVFGYPTVTLFHNQSRSQYSGPRTAAAMEAWVLSAGVKPAAPRKPRTKRTREVVSST